MLTYVKLLGFVALGWALVWLCLRAWVGLSNIKAALAERRTERRRRDAESKRQKNLSRMAKEGTMTQS